MSAPRWTVSAAAMLIAFVTCASARAADVDATVLAHQRELFDRANKLYDQQKLAEAEVVYLEAWALRHSYDIAGNLGNLEYDLKSWRKAAAFLAFAVEALPAGTKPAARDALLARLTEVEREVCKLRVTVSRAGADVVIDDASVGTSPLPSAIYVDPGPHVVEARLAGYLPARASAVGAKGSAEEVSLALAPGGPSRKIIITGAATTAAFLAHGALFAGLWALEGGHASTLASMVPKASPCPVDGTGATGTCASLKSELETRAAFGTAAIVGFAVAGGVGIATLAYGLAASPRRADSARLIVAPVGFSQGGGLLLRGAY